VVVALVAASVRPHQILEQSKHGKMDPSSHDHERQMQNTQHLVDLPTFQGADPRRRMQVRHSTNRKLITDQAHQGLASNLQVILNAQLL
jgi:hypothetical protein